MMDIFGVGIVYEALDGNRDPLIERLLDPGQTLTMEERRHLADHLQRKLKRPPHRPASQKTRRGSLLVATYVADLELIGVQSNEAVGCAMEVFSRSERTVRGDLAQAKANPAWVRSLQMRREIVEEKLADLRMNLITLLRRRIKQATDCKEVDLSA